MATSSVGYVALLRRNWRFRRLWYGQLTSQLGDWLDSIALYAIILKLTGSGVALGALVVAQFLPSALVGLGAGVVVDRFSRKWVMVASDVGCAFLVLLFLFVRSAEDVWIIYVVTVLKVSLTSFFEPAREAVIPDVTEREELIAANGISGVTWSVMLAGGAALGGAVVGTFGTEMAFLLDSFSFVLSALVTASIPIHETHHHDRAATSAWQEMREGFRFLVSRSDVAIYASSKALWCLGGGVLVVITLYGRDLFPLGVDGGLSIGLLYAARGVGAGLGPILAMRFGGSSIPFLRRMLGPGFLFMAVGYALLSVSPNLAWAMLAIVFAHMGGSAQWVFSTALLQLTVPPRLQGRVFAIELALLTLAISLSSYTTGAAASEGWSPPSLALALSAVFVPPAIGLTVLLWRPAAKEEAAADHRE
ncbi:MAG: MFS transporter [Gemmataceae bacterium]|nr:MFS transporter [Gemmataceae bacterium]